MNDEGLPKGQLNGLHVNTFIMFYASRWEGIMLGLRSVVKLISKSSLAIKCLNFIG